jgi:hypothetical protein
MSVAYPFELLIPAVARHVAGLLYHCEAPNAEVEHCLTFIRDSIANFSRRDGQIACIEEPEQQGDSGGWDTLWIGTADEFATKVAVISGPLKGHIEDLAKSNDPRLITVALAMHITYLFIETGASAYDIHRMLEHIRLQVIKLHEAAESRTDDERQESA